MHERVGPRGPNAAAEQSSKEFDRRSEPKLFATADAARALGVSRRHVRRLTSSGQLSLFARTPGGQMLFDPDVVHRLKRHRGAQRWVFKTERAWRAAGEQWRDATQHLRMAKAKIERVPIRTSLDAALRKTTGIA